MQLPKTMSLDIPSELVKEVASKKKRETSINVNKYMGTISFSANVFV